MIHSPMRSLVIGGLAKGASSFNVFKFHRAGVGGKKDPEKSAHAGYILSFTCKNVRHPRTAAPNAWWISWETWIGATLLEKLRFFTRE